MKRGLVALAASLLLVGCLDIDSGIALSRDDSGRLTVVYEIERSAYEMGVFDDSDNALPIPVSKAEFEMTADRFDGLRLRHHGVEVGDETVVVTAQLDFTSISALSAWYGPGTIQHTENGGRTEFRQVIVPGNGSTGEMAQALAQSLEGYAVTYRLEAPRQISSVSAGEVQSDGRNAVVTRMLSVVVTATAAETWVVEW